MMAIALGDNHLIMLYLPLSNVTKINDSYLYGQREDSLKSKEKNCYGQIPVVGVSLKKKKKGVSLKKEEETKVVSLKKEKKKMSLPKITIIAKSRTFFTLNLIGLYLHVHYPPDR